MCIRDRLGTGVNVQDKVIAINHLDCPWKPSDITQRNGRGVRQGNENPEVIVKQFVTKGTFDAYLWQIQEQKLRYITQIMTGRHIEPSYYHSYIRQPQQRTMVSSRWRHRSYCLLYTSRCV